MQMGLEDVIPDEIRNKSSSGSTRRKSRKPSPEDDPDVKVIGKEPFRKAFPIEKWEKVKSVIRYEMGLNVNEVLNNLTAERRYEVLHEAATWENDNLSEKQKELRSPNRCIVCGKTGEGDEMVEIADSTVHIHHTVAQLSKALED